MADTWSIRRFESAIEKWCDDVEAALDDVIELTGGKVLTDLVDMAPVDTGLFRGNMQVTANEIPLYAVQNYDKDGSDTIAKGKRNLHSILRGGGAVRSIHFSNMLIYANALEDGHSMQAPVGVFGVVQGRLFRYLSEAIQEARRKNNL